MESVLPPVAEPIVDSSGDVDRTIVVDSGKPGRDIPGDLINVTLEALPGPDGVTTLVEALFAATNAPDLSVRIVLDPKGTRAIRVGALAPWEHLRVPPNVEQIASSSESMVYLDGPDDRRQEGFWLDGGWDGHRTLTISGVGFRGFRASALTIPEAATGADVTVAGCRFERNERAIYQEAGRLTVAGCTFADSDLIGIKSVASDLAVRASTFERTGRARRTDHGSYAILLDRSTSARIEGNRFVDNTGAPGMAWVVFADHAARCRIADNLFERNAVTQEIAGGTCEVMRNEFRAESKPGGNGREPRADRSDHS